MSQTRQRLSRGDYVYSAHSLRLAGNVVDVFVGRWEMSEDGQPRKLFKYSADVEVEGGQLMCVLRLRDPISVEDYREVHHPDIRPITKSTSDDIKLILMTADIACTLPDSM